MRVYGSYARSDQGPWEPWALLSAFSPNDLEAELELADRLVTQAVAYRDWVRHTACLLTSGKAAESPKPPLAKAVRMILAETPRPWRMTELRDELILREWWPQGATPERQLTNRVTGLVKRGDVVRPSRGVVALRGDAAAQDARYHQEREA